MLSILVSFATTKVEPECWKFGLQLIATKTEYIAYNVPEHQSMTIVNDCAIKEVVDLKYQASNF